MTQITHYADGWLRKCLVFKPFPAPPISRDTALSIPCHIAYQHRYIGHRSLSSIRTSSAAADRGDNAVRTCGAMHGFYATLMRTKIGLNLNTLAASTAIRRLPSTSADIRLTCTVSAKRRYFPVNCWFVGDAVSSPGAFLFFVLYQAASGSHERNES